MVQLDYAALSARPVQTDPFPYVVVPRFISPDDFPGVTADLPPIAKGGLFPAESVHAGARVHALITHLEGGQLRTALADKFGVDLDGAPIMLALRGWSRAKDGRIHRDTPAKRVSVLLYLNADWEPWYRHDGCLRLLRGPDDIDDYVAEIPPADGTLVAFVNGPGAWHGYRSFVGQRYALQLSYMTSAASARRELRRHRLSAFVKRLAGAA